MVAQRHRDRLPELKRKVEDWHSYFKENIERYNKFMRFVFSSALTQQERDALSEVGKPPLEFNVLEAYISQLRGEFSSQTPSLVVKPSDTIADANLTEDFLAQMAVIEGHLREIILSPRKDGLQDKIYRDILAGGFSIVEIYTDYMNNWSFDQNIYVDRVFDPTLSGFDPLAKKSHKGDGQYCFQLYARTKEEFEEEYGKDLTKNIDFSRSGEFRWSYTNGQQQTVLICDFYEKKKKKIKIVKLSTGKTIAEKHYKDLLELWEARGFTEQAPVIVNERYTDLETIVRYQFCGNEMLDHTETNFDMLPLIFVDGNSVDVRDNASGVMRQMTRPYVYNAEGIQRLKNFSGQTIAAEIENMVQHKFKVALESIPEDYQDAYTNVQQADVLAYNAFYKGDPSVPLPPPNEIMRVPTPPIVESTFVGTDRLTEIILGSYNSTLATNEKNVSGVAIANGSIVSSAAAAPYLAGYINGLNRIAEVVVSLIPKYYITPRTLPILTHEGKRAYQVINKPIVAGSIQIDYNLRDLDVSVSAGVNNNLQKNNALNLISQMMQSSPIFAEFINEMGLDVLIDNMDIRGVDILKAKAQEFMQDREEAARQMSEQADPQVELYDRMSEIEEAKIEQKREQTENDFMINSAKVANEKQKIDAQVLEIMSEIESRHVNDELKQERMDSENARTAVEMIIDAADKMHDNVRKTTDIFLENKLDE